MRTRSAQLDFDRLADALGAMIKRVSGALRDCRTALERNDAIIAAQLVAADEDIDALQQRVETVALRVIASRQPMARDLRWVLASVSVAAELERIGDYTKRIAGRIVAMKQQRQPLLALPDLIRLGVLVQESYDASLSAFYAEDADAARLAARLDDQVDQVYESVYGTVRSIVIDDSSCFDAGQASLAIAYAFERLSDRATNIAERTIFLATTVHEALNQ